MTLQMLSRDIELKKEPQGALQLTVKQDGGVKTYGGVQVKLAFPLSTEDSVISFREADGTEIGLLLDAQGLDDFSQGTLQEAIRLAYFIPKIKRINQIKEEYGVTRWTVETDRGARSFDVQSRHDIRPIGKARYLIRDIDGNRFEIPDLHALDRESRSLLDLEI